MKYLVSTIIILCFASVSRSAEPVTASQPPSSIPSFVVPPVQERVVVFSDRGRTFLVGVTTGKVLVVDSATPAPYPVPPLPYPVPPAPYPVPPLLQGLAKTAYEAVMTGDPINRVPGCKALVGAIESTLSEVGGLGITDAQAIINLLAANSEAAQVGFLLKGFKLGDILAKANITTKESLIKALEEIKVGLEAVR